MSIYLILASLLVTAMARKGRARRKFRRYIPGRIDFELALSTLAGNTALSSNETNVLTESAFLTSVKCSWALQGMTAVAADGPIVCGVAHSDYTTAEIEEWIEEGASWDQGDKISEEITRRKIRQVGVFETRGAGTDSVSLNDGRMITTKCRWGLVTGDTVKFWAYNSGAGALTAGAVLHVNGKANLWPN